jgi:hypothetical protein
MSYLLLTFANFLFFLTLVFGVELISFSTLLNFPNKAFMELYVD